MKVTRGLLKYNKAKSRVGEAISGIEAGVLEGLYRHSQHPKVLRARAKQRKFRIQRAGTNPYRAAINDQNRLINTAAKATTAVQNPGATIADTAKWAAENPGLAAGTGLNYTLVASSLAAGNPAAAARFQAIPFAPSGHIIDQKLQKLVPVYKDMTTDLGSAVGALTSPIRDITSREIASVGKIMTATGQPEDFEAVSRLIQRTGRKVIKVGDQIVDLGKLVVKFPKRPTPNLSYI